MKKTSSSLLAATAALGLIAGAAGAAGPVALGPQSNPDSGDSVQEGTDD